MSTLSSENPTIDRASQPQASAAEADDARRGRTRIRWFLGGFIAGIVLDFVSTTMQVVGSVYTLADAPHLILWNLAAAPYLGTIAGLIGLIRTRRPGPWDWRRPRFRTQTLMILVAYLAFLCSAFVSSGRLRMIEMNHLQKAINCEERVKVFREQGLKAEPELKLRRQNAAQIQAGQIPEGLFEGQADFLRALDKDPKVTPAYREYRRGLIQETQSDAAAGMELSIAFCRKVVEYQGKLAKKYRQARLRPWLTVEPDPPPPY